MDTSYLIRVVLYISVEILVVIRDDLMAFWLSPEESTRDPISSRDFDNGQTWYDGHNNFPEIEY